LHTAHKTEAFDTDTDVHSHTHTHTHTHTLALIIHASAHALWRSHVQSSRAKDIALDRFELDKWVTLLRGIDETLVGLDAARPDFILDVWNIFRVHGSP
jgi:hypothetical protein